MVVGSANFPEDELLAEIYLDRRSRAPRDQGHAQVQHRRPRGLLPGDREGRDHVIPEYNGALLTTSVDTTSTAATTAEVDAALNAKLPCLAGDPEPFVGAGQGLGHGDPGVRQGAPPDLDLRPQVDRQDDGHRRPAGVQDPRGRPDRAAQELRAARSSPSTPLGRVRPDHPGRPQAGKVQAADVFTTTPQIITDHLVALADPKFNFAAQNVVPLVYKPGVNSKIIATLNAISAKLTTRRPARHGQGHHPGPRRATRPSATYWLNRSASRAAPARG